MIGVVRKNGCRPPQLFGEHRAGEKVRPGRSTEGDEQVGRSPVAVGEPVRSPDHEPRLPLAAVAPLLELAGQCERAELLAFFIEKDGYAILRRRRELAAALLQLADLGRPRDALQIAIDQLRLRAPSDPSARNYVKYKA